MIENLQIHTANLQAPTVSKGTSGGEIDTYATTVSNMPCRVIDVAATWKVFYSQRQIEVTHQVYTNQQPTVKAGYQLIWNSKTLRVMGVYSLKGGTQNIIQIDCQELLTGR